MKVVRIEIRHTDPPVKHVPFTHAERGQGVRVTRAWHAQNPATKVGSSGRTRIAAIRRVRKLELELGLAAGVPVR